MRFAGWYSILVGGLMLAQWAFFLAAGQVPELQTRPVEIMFHLAAETLTAAALIAGGVGVLRRLRWGRTALHVALGMLAYTAITSAGYFAQQGAWALVGMFALIFALAALSVRLAAGGSWLPAVVDQRVRAKT